MLSRLGASTSGMRSRTAVLALAFLLLCSAKGGGVELITPSILQDQPAAKVSVAVNTGLWRYLRAGLNFVEASGRDVPIDYVHPGGVAYGPLALTRIAVKDVTRRFQEMSAYTIDEILSDRYLYERCAKLYADLLLRHYLKIGNKNISREEVFDILQRAWFLGPTIFKRGGHIPGGRARNAREYVAIARTG